jgi:hypothetical protein
MCEACLRRRAQPGVRICRLCETETTARLRRQPAIQADLLITLSRQAKLDPNPEAGKTAARNLDWVKLGPKYLPGIGWAPPEQALTHRELKRIIAANRMGNHQAALLLDRQRALLVDWVRRLNDSIDTVPLSITVLAASLANHMPDLRVRDDVAQLAVAVADLAVEAARAVDHPLMKAVAIGKCPNPVGEHEDQPCPGIVKAFIPLDGTDRESSIKCTRGHEWAGNQRRSLARRLRQTGRLLV